MIPKWNTSDVPHVGTECGRRRQQTAAVSDGGKPRQCERESGAMPTWALGDMPAHPPWQQLRRILNGAVEAVETQQEDDRSPHD